MKRLLDLRRIGIWGALGALLWACSPQTSKPLEALPPPPPSAKQAETAPVEPWATHIPAGFPHDVHKASATSREGMVATDSALATKVGVETLRKGGNAIDAAVSVALALAVVFPQAGNLGGGGFMLVRTKEGEVSALDFREVAPLLATRDMFVGKNEQSLVGPLAAGVPGSVAGLYEAHKKLGKLDWKEVVAPAIVLAKEGFLVDAGLAGSVKARASELGRFDGSKELFLPNGVSIAEGSSLKNPDLGRALERIAEKGAAGFYEGETAKLVVEEMRKGGGIIGEKDLASYKPIWRKPIVVDYRNHKVFSMPPPSSGGLVLAFSLKVLSGFDLTKSGFLSAESVHFVAETSRRAFALRNHYLGDPAFVAIPNDVFLSDEAIQKARASIDLNHATPSSEVTPKTGGANEKKHTTHFSVVDRDGAAVALTTTINTSLGSAVVVRGAGFLLNNEMDDFATEPGKPNVFGLVQGEANAIAKGKRMLSSMTPTIVVSGQGQTESVRIVTGASGGPTIISAALGVITNVLDHQMPVTAAVAAPRIHHQHLPDRILYENAGLDGAVVDLLRARGHQLEATDAIADAPSIVRDASGLLSGSAEPRNPNGLAQGL